MGTKAEETVEALKKCTRMFPGSGWAVVLVQRETGKEVPIIFFRSPSSEPIDMAMTRELIPAEVLRSTPVATVKVVETHGIIGLP